MIYNSNSFGIDNLFFKLSNLFDLFDQCDSQRMLLVLVKWACFQYIWEQLIDCLMRIMRRFTLRECPYTKERYDFHIQLYLSCNSSSDLKVFCGFLHPNGFSEVLNILVQYTLMLIWGPTAQTHICLYTLTKLPI